MQKQIIFDMENNNNAIANESEVVENAQPTQELGNKAKWEQAVRSKYGEDLSEDDLYAKVGADYDAEKNVANSARKDREILQKSVMADPDVESFIRDVMNGRSISEAAKNIPDDLPDTDKIGFANMNAEAQRRAEAAEESMNQLSANLDASQKAIEQYMKDNNIGKEESTELVQRLMNEVVQPIAEGNIDASLMDIVVKGLCYDKHKSIWEEAGRVAGKNDKIEEDKEKFRKGIDGLPSVESNSGVKKDDVNKDGDWLNNAISAQSPHPLFG